VSLLASCSPERADSLLKREEREPSFSVEDFRALGLLNDRGQPRLARAQGYFSQERNDQLLMDLYEHWRDLPEFVVLRRPKRIWRDPTASAWEYRAFKCSKRGNDVYSKRVQKRLDWLKDLPNKEFFKISDFNMKKKVSTQLLWVTLTYDPGLCDRITAWENLGSEYSRFMHLLRKKYGKISALRVWESFENGYPHCHVCLYFHDAKFSVFPWISMKEGKFSFRISEKAQISQLWHSHADVEAISSMKKLGSYVRKYQMKVYQGESSKSVKTMAFCWIHRKRSFALSGSFRAALHDLIERLHNWAMKEVQVSLDGEILEENPWEFVCVCTGQELHIQDHLWVTHLEGDQIKTVQEIEAQLQNPLWKRYQILEAA
jgi:hypothetical protein